MKALRTILLALATTMMFSCGDDNDGLEGGGNPAPGINEKSILTLEFSRQVIQANGQDAADFIVKVDGQPVTSGYTIYDQNDAPVSSASFTTTKPGEYSFWATYKTLHSENVVLKAISIPVPELPADPSPEKTEFQKKVLMSQFTGNRCPNCPRMTVVVREVLAKQEMKDKVVMTSPHTYNSSDPGYLETPIASSFGIASYPTMLFDLALSKTYSYNFTADWLTSMINSRYAVPATAGISAKSELITNAEGAKQIALHVAIKAAKEGNYRVGAWLLEDSIKAKQANVGIEGDFDTHNNVVRIADSKGVNNAKYSGVDLGTIHAQKTAEHVFIMNLNPKWVEKNLHIAIFVTNKQEDGSLPVVNVIDCPIVCSLPFNYTK